MSIPLYPCVSIGPSGCIEPEDITVDTPWMEIRIDLLPQSVPRAANHLLPWLQRLEQKFRYIILTYKQGDSDAQRLETLAAILQEFPCFIDVDYADNQFYRAELLSLAADKECLTLLSYHMPTWDGQMDSIRLLLHRMQQLQPFFTKLALPTPTPFHFLDFLSLYAQYEHLIIVDSGPHGLATRLLTPILGAPFTYGYFDVPTAPNQPKASDLKRLLDEYQAIENQTIAIS